MSCHNIGRGLNHVVKKIIELYDENKISKEVAINLIVRARDAVVVCDGNEYEAVDCIFDRRCGGCLEEVKTVDIFEVSNELDIDSLFFELWRKISDNFTHWCLCKECFYNIIDKQIENKELSEKIKLEFEHIISNN